MTRAGINQTIQTNKTSRFRRALDRYFFIIVITLNAGYFYDVFVMAEASFIRPGFAKARQLNERTSTL